MSLIKNIEIKTTYPKYWNKNNYEPNYS